MRHPLKVQDLTVMALLTALLCASAYMIFPLPFSPVSVTAQTLVVNLLALVLLPKQAVMVMFVYMLLGLVGLPVFSGGMGGPAKLFGPTGGYLFSWIPATFFISWLKGKRYHLGRYCVVTICVGMPIIYAMGSVYMNLLTGMDLMAVLMAAVIPFIPMDIAKCVGAAVLAKSVQKVLAQKNTAG